jgi:hypothetical protein
MPACQNDRRNASLPLLNYINTFVTGRRGRRITLVARPANAGEADRGPLASDLGDDGGCRRDDGTVPTEILICLLFVDGRTG